MNKRLLISISALTLGLFAGCGGGAPVVSGPVCGDGVVEGAEVCEAGDLRGESCDSLGLGTGQLACLPDCSGFDTIDCSISSCGDGYVSAGEVCDGGNFQGETCASLGYEGGTLSCESDCSGFDTSRCTGGGTCGDDLAEGSETCDGSDLRGETCESQGYLSGDLACLGDCTGYDTSNCQEGVCGDGILTGEETCDGTNFGGLTCADFGFENGTLACIADCSQVDPSGCSNLPMVLINEVGMGSPDWVELLNTSGEAVELEGFVLNWWGVDNNGNPQEAELLFPAYSLAAGGRVILEDTFNGQGGDPVVAGNLITFDENIWWGSAPGAVALSTADASPLDFVRWGRSETEAPAGTGWQDTPVSWPGTDSDDVTLSRVPDGQDTDTAGDFCMTPATQGDPNDECGPGPGALLLTEVDVAMPDRVEIYNPGADAVDLEGWFLYWVTPTEDGYTELPTFTLEPGAYAYMVDDVANPMTPAYVDGQGVIHIRNINWGR